jgi:8-oxo-dGTP pyrophosphatase MutT (NUDIX family)
MSNEATKILFENEWFDVIEADGFVGIEPKHINVIVMPYTRGKGGVIDNIGVRIEKNPLRKEGMNTTLITGDAEGEDPDFLYTAIRECKEESGFYVNDIERWTYLGVFTNSKLVRQEQPCFAVDVTGLTPDVAEGDGTKEEDASTFKLVPVHQALLSNDIYIPAVFVRAFNYIVNNQ